MTDSSTSADQSVLELYPPRLPLATEPVIGAHYGVPLHIYDLDPMGCKVEVGPYLGQQAGDTVSINLNGETGLDSDQTQGIDDAVTLYIPHRKLWHGNINRLTYTAKRGSTNLDTSLPLEIIYNSIRPGNQDRTPGDGEHSELELLLPDEIKNGVGPGFTSATVCVSYPYCRAHDRIWLNCNGTPKYHTVTETEAPPPPEHGSATPTKVCFEVTSADLGNDHPQFKFSYTVNDQLNNSPDPNAPWSAVQTVDVDQAGNRLPAPIPREIASDVVDDPNTIDLDKLGSNPLLLIILTVDPRFMPGDSVEATYISKVAGQPDVVTTVTGSVEADEFGQKKPCILQILNDKVIPASTVEMTYKLFRNTALMGASRTARAIVVGGAQAPLPPTIDEAPDGQLDPANTPNGATVRIPAEVNLLGGDRGEVRWVGLPGAGSINVPFTISSSEAGQSKPVVVPQSVVLANVDRTITLDYTLRRQGGSPVPSQPAVYDVRRQVGSGQLLVMGARGTSNSLHWTTVGSSRLLTALNAVTQQPLEALWRYEGDSGDPIRSAVFHDKQPWRLLHVSTSEDEVRVNPANLFGCGNFKIHDPSQPWGAFIARRNQGNLIGWGVPGHGGAVPSTIATLTDIVGVAHAAYAFAAWRANGRVVAWGWEERGGVVPAAIGNLTDIVEVVGTGHAFAALRATGHLVAWGDAIAGGVIPADIAQLDDFEEVAASAHAFAARRANGTVVAWGRADLGGAVPSDIASLTDIVELSNAYYVFAARRANGSVVAWGTEPNAGGTVPAAIATLTDIVEVVGASTALAARRSNGSVVAWGNANSGGAIPAPIATLNDIIQVVSTSGSFAALRASGHVVTWGSSDHGAPVPATIGVFDDIVQIAATAAAFAALRRNGTVVAWGNETWGGVVNVNDLTNVRALYANSQAFVALTSDGRVVTWGLADAGGNSDSVQGQLRGQISYYATPASRGAALKRQARSEGA
ncbi:hypothetical protein LOY67_07490 [Pseudomonas sp. B21-056]|jgi:alpha-tubulin suppressor-like RCC1 family protein|uniref:RCC1 domain-containing protein n=1 Tax=Pseudomonas sp. B21-056 TaxID=2895495 RepID=UPI00222FAC97|nr:hypothetical protein [Pseudomonas sp. B21-056]UZE25240.1 hypothetical protein LOY67_07490 [Pseudomonas sp. B21-056]